MPGEARVALVPEVVGKLKAAGYEIAVEPDAGRLALVPDEAYAAAGVEVTDGALLEADVVVSVQPLAEAALRSLRRGAATISFYPPTARAADLVQRLERGLVTFGMEYVPRISRAQSMDALSSQSLVAGYRAAIVAAGRLRQFFPLSMTAAGTVPPAQIVVLGAGVAGLQASPPVAGWVPWSRATTYARPRPRRSVPWAPRRSSSTYPRWRVRAGTPGR